ncbi:glutathione S-transferase family protein [Coralliovum pocilloporae]|uniref:glutathione S-transferase family protein n=1 Tax=Coralliovum pocilloporae TaxID=3066369 RepID=UPI00330714D4
MHKLYATYGSGNCYKVQLLMHQIGIPFTVKNIDVLKGETKSEAYLAINPNGKVPFLSLENGETIGESNAMLQHLAHGTHLTPESHFDRIKMFEWMLWEQSSHEPNISPARFMIAILPELREANKDRIAEWQQKGNKALGIMNNYLAKHDWLAGEKYSIADISLYGYTHVAHEGEFDMDQYPHIQAWMARVAETPNYISMPEIMQDLLKAA